jgi:hypothetical protein
VKSGKIPRRYGDPDIFNPIVIIGTLGVLGNITFGITVFLWLLSRMRLCLSYL